MLDPSVANKVFHVESVVLGSGEERGWAVSVGEVDSGDETLTLTINPTLTLTLT